MSSASVTYRHDEWCASVLDGAGESCDCYIRHLEEKDRRIAELEEALRWYAEARTWNQWLPDSAGDRARRALEKK